MTTVTIRKKLHEFIADADEKKIKGMYLLLEDEIIKKEEFKLTSSHISILEEEKINYAKGLPGSYNWTEAKEIIRGNKSIE